MKAILVIDMPEGCCQCHLARDLCHGTIPPEKWYKKRPDWCPLKPMPQKKESDRTLFTESHIYKSGWNACIEEINATEKVINAKNVALKGETE